MLNIDQLIESEGLFLTEYTEDWSFVWRILSLKEYRVFRSLRDSGTLLPYSVYLEVFKRCYVGDHRALNKRIPLGMLVSIGELIMYVSGDCELDTLKDDIEIARRIYPATSVNERMKQVIFTAFPSYKIHEVENWTRPTLIKNFIIAEEILSNRGVGYERLDINEIKSPEEVRAEQDQPAVINPRIANLDKIAERDRKELGVWAVEDARDLEQQRQRTLTTEQARKLDQLTRPGS